MTALRRVLHVLNSASGGAALSALGLMNSLREHGYESCAVCHQSGTSAEHDALEEATQGRVEYTHLYWWNRKNRSPWWKRPLIEARQIWRTGWLRSSTKQVTEAARRHQACLIHSNTILTLEGGRAARGLGLPHVWHLREMVGPGQPFRFPVEGKAFGQFVAGLSQAVVANSQSSAACIRDWLPPNLLEVIPNGIDVKPFVSLPWRLRKDRLVVAMVGSLTSRWKKHMLFVEAAIQTSNDLPIEFRIYGTDPSQGGTNLSDPYVAQIHERLRATHCEQRFHWPGFVQEPARLMSEIDVLVHPADQESFGRIFVEAMAAGLPVIGVRGGGAADIVIHDQTGILVAPDNSTELARAIESLAQDASLRMRYGKAGRDRAIACFSINKSASRIAQLYERLLPKWVARSDTTKSSDTYPAIAS